MFIANFIRNVQCVSVEVEHSRKYYTVVYLKEE